MEPRPRPADKGLALVVGRGAAIAAHGSSLSREALVFAFRGFVPTFGAGAAIEPHKSSSAFMPTCASAFMPTCDVDFGRGIEAVAKKKNTV